MMNLEEAKKSEESLRNDGYELLEHFKILERLARFGKPVVVGSLQNKTMVKNDIDIRINLNEDPSKQTENLANLSKELLLLPGMIQLHVSNKGDLVSPGIGKPKGIYIGIKPFYKGNRWTIDTWVVKPEDEIILNVSTDNMDQDIRDKVILIKHQLAEIGKYNKDYNSADIYRAVIRDGVGNVDELDKWRITHPNHSED